MLGWTFPSATGTAPAESQPVAWFASAASAVCIKSIVTRWPAPLRSRSRSAARTAVVGVEARDHVHEGDADLGRLARRPGDAHQAADRLDERVVPRQVGTALLAEAGDLAVDDAPVPFRDLLVADAEPLQGAGAEVRDDDVRALAQARRHRCVRRLLEVERDRALVAVRRVVVGRPAGGVGGRLPAARVVAARRLDLDHVRAEVAERHRDERPGEDARQVDDDDVVERRGVVGPRGHGSVRTARDGTRPSRVSARASLAASSG